MDLSLGSLMLPVSGLALFDTIAILTLLPIFDGYVYPFFKTKGRNGLTMLDKIGLGFLCMVLAMAVAGLVEMLRLSEKATAGDYMDEAARDNISPCQNVDDYNPFQFQQWDAGEVDNLTVCLLFHQLCDFFSNKVLCSALLYSVLLCSVVMFLGNRTWTSPPTASKCPAATRTS